LKPQLKVTSAKQNTGKRRPAGGNTSRKKGESQRPEKGKKSPHEMSKKRITKGELNLPNLNISGESTEIFKKGGEKEVPL